MNDDNNTIEARYNDVSAGVFRIATARADLLPPVISGVTVTNQFGRPIIRWTTDEPATTRVDFGTNSTLTASTNDPVLTQQHRISLEDLKPGVTYFFRVISADEAGNIYVPYTNYMDAETQEKGLFVARLNPDLTWAGPFLVSGVGQNSLPWPAASHVRCLPSSCSTRTRWFPLIG